MDTIPATPIQGELPQAGKGATQGSGSLMQDAKDQSDRNIWAKAVGGIGGQVASGFGGNNNTAPSPKFGGFQPLSVQPSQIDPRQMFSLNQNQGGGASSQKLIEFLKKSGYLNS